MAWDNNAERKEHTRESAEVTISLDKEELEKIAAFAELDVDTMSVEDLAEALHGIVAVMIRQSLLPTSLKRILTMPFPTLYISRGIPLKK